MAVSPPQGSHARGTMLQSHDPPARQTGEVFMETRSTGRGHVLKVQRRATSWIVLRPQARRRIVLRKSAGRTPRGCAAPRNRSGGSGKVGCRRATQGGGVPPSPRCLILPAGITGSGRPRRTRPGGVSGRGHSLRRVHPAGLRCSGAGSARTRGNRRWVHLPVEHPMDLLHLPAARRP